jgi:hypothetical protein
MVAKDSSLEKHRRIKFIIEALRDDACNIPLWLELSNLYSDTARKMEIFNAVLMIDPGNEIATRGLKSLEEHNRVIAEGENEEPAQKGFPPIEEPLIGDSLATFPEVRYWQDEKRPGDGGVTFLAGYNPGQEALEETLIIQKKPFPKWFETGCLVFLVLGILIMIGLIMWSVLLSYPY